jgi:hypothetical protein
MAKTFPVGHMRVNPNTFMSEVWNGSQWISNANTVTSSISTNGITNVGAISSNVKPIFSAIERELIFEYLKRNLRVAEYRDGDGKIETVELQMRLDDGYSWESIRREKIIRSKTKI